MDNRIAAGAGIFLALQVFEVYQLTLPPLYGEEHVDTRQITQASRFTAIFILVLAFLTGILTRSVWPLILPAIAIGALHLVWLMESGNRILRDLPNEEALD